MRRLQRESGVDARMTTEYPATPANAVPRGIRRWLPLFLIVGLFFLWGAANNLNDVLIAQFKMAFVLDDFQAGLVQSAFYLGYFLVAMPAAMFMRRFGYKEAVVVGLVLYGAGALLFWPAAQLRTYGMFLFALFVIATGLAFLETSANPLMTVLGPREGAARRLNFAQAFNPLGSIAGVLIGKHFILAGVEHTPQQLAAMGAAERATYYTAATHAVQGPYLCIGLVVLAWALLVLVMRFPAVAAPHVPATRATGHDGALARLLRDRGFTGAMAAQFFYVGAQVGVWSYTIRYVQATMPGTSAHAAANFILVALVCFMAGRFVGAALMKYLAPVRLLLAFAAINVVLTLYALLQPGMGGACALVACSFFMSVMYPTIFALGVEGMDDDERKLGSALLVMTIIGGAVLTAAMGAVSDRAGIARALGVPALSFAVVAWFAWRRLPRGGKAAS
jgi:FHS family L-fucose permease-like MFS transporter